MAAAMTWTLHLDDAAIPDRTLNARGHWAHRASHAAQVRETVAWVASTVDRPAPPVTLQSPRRLTCIRWVPDRRIRDVDNIAAAFKPAIDGLVDAGVLPGDDRRYVPEILYAIRWRKQPGWTIELEQPA